MAACFSETYSSGDCPGFTPVFPFKQRQHQKMKTKSGYTPRFSFYHLHAAIALHNAAKVAQKSDRA
jgi:hypothetical protein